MNREEFKALSPSSELVTSDHLANKAPRTLLLGTRSDGTSLHVYLTEERTIHVLNFLGGYTLNYLRGTPEEPDMPNYGAPVPEVTSNEQYLPETLAPEFCDAEFCQLLMGRGITLPFGEFNAEALAFAPVEKFGGYYAPVQISMSKLKLVQLKSVTGLALPFLSKEFYRQAARDLGVLLVDTADSCFASEEDHKALFSVASAYVLGFKLSFGELAEAPILAAAHSLAFASSLGFKPQDPSIKFTQAELDGGILRARLEVDNLDEVLELMDHPEIGDDGVLVTCLDGVTGTLYRTESGILVERQLFGNPHTVQRSAFIPLEA